MTDKEQIINQCKTCDVEPPAMKFKCPECEHNTENENFAKDINVPSKEQIMVDGVDISKCDSECFFSKCRGSRCAKWNVLKMKELEEQLTRKTQECEELKEELTTYKKMLDNPEFRVALTDIRTGEREVWRKLGSKADHYREALDEIEEIAKDWYKNEWSCYKCRINMDNKLKNILDIINKADFGKSEQSETRPGESCVEPVEPPIIQEAKGEE